MDDDGTSCVDLRYAIETVAYITQFFKGKAIESVGEGTLSYLHLPPGRPVGFAQNQREIVGSHSPQIHVHSGIKLLIAVNSKIVKMDQNVQI